MIAPGNLYLHPHQQTLSRSGGYCFIIIIIIFYYYFTHSVFFTILLTGGHLQETEWQQASSGLQDPSEYSNWFFNNVVVWMVLILPLISTFSYGRKIPSAPNMIGISITLMFYRFLFSGKVLVIVYLFVFFLFHFLRVFHTRFLLVDFTEWVTSLLKSPGCFWVFSPISTLMWSWWSWFFL